MLVFAPNAPHPTLHLGHICTLWLLHPRGGSIVVPRIHKVSPSPRHNRQQTNATTQPSVCMPACRIGKARLPCAVAEQRPRAEAAILGALNIREPMRYLLFPKTLFPSSSPAAEERPFLSISLIASFTIIMLFHATTMPVRTQENNTILEPLPDHYASILAHFVHQRHVHILTFSLLASYQILSVSAYMESTFFVDRTLLLSAK